MKAKWFGVKVLIRAELVGRPGKRGRSYDPDATLVEERVLIVRAADGTAAAPSEGREVFSDTRRFSKHVSDEDVASELLSNALRPRDQQRRRQFLDETIAGGLDAYMPAPNLPLQRTISPRARRSNIAAPTRRRSRR